ncbi:MAG: DUF4349 domain-containing protein [Acidobacteriota bacterium]|nr:DUF4349 domain-containing protein [Acidobacteriota bacterium]MDH3529408.1 DUF4349 domain-containing protein [Acidobacteriota bacterium]
MTKAVFMKRAVIGLILMALVVFSGCAREDATSSRSADYKDQPQNMIAPEDEGVSSNDPEQGGGGGGKKEEVSLDNAIEVTERKIIRNAILQLESEKPQETQKKIVDIANANGGYVLESNARQADNELRNQNRFSVILQVPSAKFDTALSEIRKTGIRVISETVKGQDVTEEFIDVEARLKTKKALEARFLAIMNRANSVKDALEVERELATVRTEIERIEGRKRSLENLTSLSKVTVHIVPPTAISASSTGFWYQLQDAVSDGFEGALTFVLVLVRVLIALIPFLLIVVLPVLLLLRYLWRKYRQNRMARAAAAEVDKITDDIE